MATNKELEQQVNSISSEVKDFGSKLDKLVDVISKQSEGFGAKEEPKVVVAPKTISGIPQKYRDAVDKVLGKDFGLRLENDDNTMVIVVPEKYSVYHTKGELAARNSHHNTMRTEFNNFITRTQPNISDDILATRMEEWDKNHQLIIPEDRRPLAMSLAVIGEDFERYCEIVKRNIEKELDTKIN